MKTSRDVVVAAMLGADEFGFGTAALVALACVMARQCHLNTCPVGVATQREDLRKKFPNEPERLVNYMRRVAQDVREILARLGFRSLKEIVGRTDLLIPTRHKIEGRRGQFDLRPLLHQPDPEIRSSVRARRPARNLDPLALRMAEDVKQALEQGISIVREYKVGNTNRTIGTRASNAVALRYGNRGMKDLFAEFRFHGSAGQSFGAFLTEGLRLVLDGEADDYVGEGLGGGEVIIRPPKESVFKSSENVIMGNAVLYGATAGKLYAVGRAEERFAVRNSGATAVVEGMSDHGCEHMTGGVAVALEG